MNRTPVQCRIPAAAIAAALAVPAPALAQSPVTVSGYFKMAVENVKLGQSAKSPNNETRVADDASRLIFSVVEDLGGGLQAIAQLDTRITSDAGTLTGSGTNFVGLRSKSWGALSLGRYDLHYQLVPSEINAKAGSYKAQSVAVLAFAGGGGTTVAGNTRTSNVIRYDSPNWSGFAFTAAYSSNAPGQEADLGSSARKGRAWNFTPTYAAGN